MLTFVLRNAVSSTSPSSLFSVLKRFQHIREVKKVQGKYEKHAAPFSLSTVHGSFYLRNKRWVKAEVPNLF